MLPLILLFLTCRQPDNERPVITREGSLLVQGDQPIVLTTFNFDNLSWWSDQIAEDGSLSCTLHHDRTDFTRIKAHGFNAVRFMINSKCFWQDDPAEGFRQEGWDWLDQNVEWAEKEKIYLVPDMHQPRGGFGTETGTWPIWTDSTMQNEFISFWRETARRYRGNPWIAGFDLMNEPTVPDTEVYLDLMNRTIQAIRAEDSDRLVIVESCAGVEGDPDSWIHPVWVFPDDQNICYSYHFYEPLPFTHNGADTPALDDLSWPMPGNGISEMEASLTSFGLAPAERGFPLFLGEFGCHDWRSGTGSDQWIDSVQSFCRDRGISTALFCYRSFHDSDPGDFGFAWSRIIFDAAAVGGHREVLNPALP
jgi:endoglucanase